MLISRLSRKKVQGCEQSEKMKKDKNRKSYTEAYQTHEDCGYGYKVVCCNRERYSKPLQTYRGENVVYKFMEKMLEEVEYCKAVIKKRFNKPLVMTEDDERRFRTMDGCHICCEKYTDKDVRVKTTTTSLKNLETLLFSFFICICMFLSYFSNLLHYEMTIISTDIVKYNGYLNVFWFDP